VPAATLVGAQHFPMYPFVDGAVLSQTLGAAFAAGQFNQVPVSPARTMTSIGCLSLRTTTTWEIR
jgi:hypothetical protein